MASPFYLHVLVGFLMLVSSLSAAFNYSKCPGPLELQTTDVMNNFDIDMYTGIYYEVAFHDYTQEPACPKEVGAPYCMSSNKTFNTAIHAIEDHFDMWCDKVDYNNITFAYNVTNIPGYFVGNVHSNHALNGSFFPDTVVAKGEIQTNPFGEKQYEYVIEFQCRMDQITSKESIIVFVGINFYSMYNHPTQSQWDTMINVAYEQGLGVYLNQSMHITDQDNCTYPWNVTETL